MPRATAARRRRRRAAGLRPSTRRLRRACAAPAPTGGERDADAAAAAGARRARARAHAAGAAAFVACFETSSTPSRPLLPRPCPPQSHPGARAHAHPGADPHARAKVLFAPLSVRISFQISARVMHRRARVHQRPRLPRPPAGPCRRTRTRPRLRAAAGCRTCSRRWRAWQAAAPCPAACSLAAAAAAAGWRRAAAPCPRARPSSLAARCCCGPWRASVSALRCCAAAALPAASAAPRHSLPCPRARRPRCARAAAIQRQVGRLRQRRAGSALGTESPHRCVAPARRRARRPDAPAAPRATLCRVTPPPRRRPDD